MTYETEQTAVTEGGWQEEWADWWQGYWSDAPERPAEGSFPGAEWTFDGGFRTGDDR